jgi:hypothetical protein
MLLSAGAVGAQSGKQLVALFSLEPGLWEIREIDNIRARPRSVCLGDPQVLVQLEHREVNCSRVVVTNDSRNTIIHYVCPINGFGQTSVRVETPRFATIDTQGIVANAPFAYRAEARRVGDCAPQKTARR